MDITAVVSTIIMVIGIVGMIYPVFPGTLLVFAGPLIYVIFNGFDKISIVVFVIIIVITAAGLFVDNIASLVGIRKFGASKQALIWALVGGVIGFFILNIPGFLIGQFIGVVTAEVSYGREFKASLKAGIGVFIGYITGYILKIILGGTILVMFIFKVL
jgi:uncharacterized protein YqgC (DUF456 family)